MKRISVKFIRGICWFVIKVILVVESVIVLRVFFKVANANPETPVVFYLYRFSDYFISPFNNIFPNLHLSSFRVVETAAVSAGAGYGLVALVSFAVIHSLSKR